MRNWTKTFAHGFVEGVLTPLAVVSSMYGLPRQPTEDPFKGVELGSFKTDKENMRKDFFRAIERVERESPELKDACRLMENGR